MSNYNVSISATLHIKKTKTAAFKKLIKAIGGEEDFKLSKGKGDVYHLSTLLGESYKGDEGAYNTLITELPNLISSRSVIVQTHLRNSTPSGIAAIRTYLPGKKPTIANCQPNAKPTVEYVGQ